MSPLIFVLPFLLLSTYASSQLQVISGPALDGEPRAGANKNLYQAPGERGALQRTLRAQSIDRNVNALRTLQHYFASLEERLQKDRRKSAGNEDTATCNGLSPWGWTAGLYLEQRGLIAASEKCVTLRYQRTGIPDARGAHDALSQIGTEFRDRAASSWTGNVHLVAEFEFNTTTHHCTLRRQAAFRLAGKWFIHVQFTNVALYGDGALGEREFIAEHVRVDGDRNFSSAAIFLNSTGNKPDVTVTELLRSNGRPSAGSLFILPELESNPAIVEALVMSENDAEQANDASQNSNTAILVLPLMMNLVPIALFADVNTLGMILYTTLTDVLTAVPLAIKGWELLSFASNAHTAAAAYYTGEMGSQENAVAELFIAQCFISDRRPGTGITFIVIALVFMIFGVSFEFVAKRYVRRRPQSQYEPFDAAAILLQQNAAVAARMHPGRGSHHSHPPGCACACHSRNHPHAQLHLRAMAFGNGFPGAFIQAAETEYSGDYDSRPHLAPGDRRD